MIVLGVHVGHDTAAALVVDGRVIADVSEERFNRLKHSYALPVNAIDYCLRQGGIDISKVDVIALATVHASDDINFLFGLSPSQPQTSAIREIYSRLRSRPRDDAPKIAYPLYFRRFPVSGSTEVVHVEHHLAHAASAYYTSGSRDRQLIVTMDGEGDHNCSGVIWRGESGRLTCLKRFYADASLGFFYSVVTEALGWRHGDGEGKTMGLAAYGDPVKAKAALAPYHPTFSSGDLVEPHDFGPMLACQDTGVYEWHAREAADVLGVIREHGREHVAAAAQQILEEQTAEIIYPWLEREGTTRLSCSGGVFLNVKLNQRIRESGKLTLHHIFPNPGDAGLAVGAALQVYYSTHPDAAFHPLENVYWGPEYSNQEIGEILANRGLKGRFEDNVAPAVARLLAENKIVGWLQGRMESGPRALGGRSILMSPLLAGNKDVLNGRVKFRESFRPFCPSIASGSAGSYMSPGCTERFMITSFDASPAKRDRIPAVVHVDGTMRPQIVDAQTNPLYHRLLEEFGSITGEPVLLNTSLNVQGEPIVCGPRDAIRCFFDTGMDYLVMGNYILGKPA